MTGRVLLYGATGFSGRLLAERMAGLGLDLVLGGRSEMKLAPLSEGLRVPRRVFGLERGEQIDQALADIAVVLNAAGPFQHTASRMMAACIRTGTHYLDIAGEWPVFVDAMDRSMAALAAGVMLMPGVGFTLAASDCLLAMAAAHLPDAAILRLAISRPGIWLRGTVRSVLDMASPYVLVRRGGGLQPVPIGALWRAFDFGESVREATAITWPDVITGQFTTGIPDIEGYIEANWTDRLTYQVSATAAAWINASVVHTTLRALSLAWPDTPSPTALQRSNYMLVVEAEDRWRRSTALRMQTLNGYAVTELVATDVVQRVFAGDHKPGFRTPASVYGGDFILALGCASLELLAA